MSRELQVLRDWHDNEVMQVYCRTLLSFFSKAKRQVHYSFAQLVDETGLDNNHVVARALQYLCSPTMEVLHQVFLREIGDELVELENDDFFIDEDGTFLDANTAEEISKSEIFVAYELIAPRDDLLEDVK